MTVKADAVAYAREVYVACATVGFDGDYATRLKALLDEYDAGTFAASDSKLVKVAESAHLAAVAWITGPEP